MSEITEKNKNKKKTVVLISISVIIILCLATFGFFAAKASTDNIYSGISVGTAYLGGMNKTQAADAISKAYTVNDINVKVECDGVTFDVYGSAFALKIDYDATAEKALSHGKSGNIFSKIAKMLSLKSNPESIDLVVKCDYNVLQYAINEKLGEKVSDVVEYNVEFGENELIVTNGKSGRVASAQKLIDSVSKAIVNGTLSDVIRLDIETVHPSPIDAEKFVTEYNRKPKDAVVNKKDDEIIITPEIVGVEISKDEAIKIIEANRNNDKAYTIPAKITYPDVTSADLEAEYLDTIIGTYTTDYSTSSQNRKTNIHLASSKINGLTLNPGEVFSFNDVVGPRTQATGYKIAHVYSGGQVVDGIGGGICQVSSTLYNAVVFADLEIVYRTNHSLPVSYVPLGRDATVSYGSIDFKIKNNKETPIKFEVLHDGSDLTINVYGRKKYIKDISIETVITGSIPYTTNEIEDDTMYVGETEVVESGANGTRVEAYKIIKENGEVVSRTLLCKSSYTPTTRVVKIGTKEKEPPAPPIAEPTPPSDGGEPSSADNPQPDTQPSSQTQTSPENTQSVTSDASVE